MNFPFNQVRRKAKESLNKDLMISSNAVKCLDDKAGQFIFNLTREASKLMVDDERKILQVKDIENAIERISLIFKIIPRDEKFFSYILNYEKEVIDSYER